MHLTQAIPPRSIRRVDRPEYAGYHAAPVSGVRPDILAHRCHGGPDVDIVMPAAAFRVDSKGQDAVLLALAQDGSFLRLTADI
ncbi:MAG: hypothetical protein EBR40_08020 [Proteobacteria bacterium]|nr:hypothetical protein [bacterium]NBZ96354.1 hypothetical protein [Pseudomonadota bacterium]